MDREAGILQDRIEVAALERRVGEARERIRCCEDEQQERRTDPALHAECAGAQCLRHDAREQRDRGPAERQDENPQKHRAFVISPNATDFVDERLCRMRILVDVCEREI